MQLICSAGSGFHIHTDALLVFVSGENMEDAPLHADPGRRSRCLVGCQVFANRPLLPLLCRSHGSPQDVTQVDLHPGRVGKCKLLLSLLSVIKMRFCISK